jgi:hypothetical protein
MRKALILMALCSVAHAQQPMSLWEGGTSVLSPTPQQREQSWVSLIPATVTQTPIEGLKLFNDPQTGRYGSVQDIGNGQSLVNTQGAENTLRLCQYTGNGQTVCN